MHSGLPGTDETACIHTQHCKALHAVQYSAVDGCTQNQQTSGMDYYGRREREERGRVVIEGFRVLGI
jgi:hypothetical protein